MAEFGLDSLRAHVGAKYALEHGKVDACCRAVFRAYWQAGRDISAP